jgi:hypothetical protein
VDPVIARRNRIAKLTEWGQRIGYALFGIAVVVFVVGAAIGFRPPIVITVTACLGVGSVILAPAIVFAYAVKAAEREDRGSS